MLASDSAIPNAAYPTGGQGLVLDPSGKVPLSALPASGPRVVTGIITSAGAITAGTGFSVSKGAAGIYTITFTAAFAAAPIVVGTLTGSSPNGFVSFGTIGTGSFIARTQLENNVDSDQAWNFLAHTVA